MFQDIDIRDFFLVDLDSVEKRNGFDIDIGDGNNDDDDDNDKQSNNCSTISKKRKRGKRRRKNTTNESITNIYKYS